MNVFLKHTVVALLWSCLVIRAGAQPELPPPPNNNSHPALKEIEKEEARLYRERTALYNSPQAPAEWKELRQLQKQVDDREVAHKKALEPLEDKRRTLTDSDAVRAWNKKIGAINAQLDQLRERKYQRVYDEGIELVRERHAELAKPRPPDVTQLRRLGFDALSFPRIDGSTSTQPLAVLIACRAFGMPYNWISRDERRKDRERDFLEFFGGKAEPEVKLAEFSLQATPDKPSDERLAVIINRLLATNASTNQAYINLVEGRSDIGLFARGPSQDELALAKMKGVELDVTPCALDAFVFLIHRDNPIRSLSSAQLRDIYSGKVTRWRNVGEYEGPITAYQREESSGSQVLMRQLVMQDTPLFTPKGDSRRAPQLVGYLMSSPYIELTDNKGGIGYSVYYYERFMMGSPQTRMLKVDGVEPNFDNIRQRRYPFVSDVAMVTRKDLDAESAAAKLRAWLLSPEGQSVVKQSGYVPVVGK